MVRKLFVFLLTLAMVLGSMMAAQADTIILDNPNDRIGDLVFEGFKMVVSDIYSPPGSSIKLFTNYPQTGYVVGDWATLPADLFLTVHTSADTYRFAVPLVDHGGFTQGVMYVLGKYYNTDYFAPSSGYIYNHGQPAWIFEAGEIGGVSSFTGGTVSWQTLAGGNPDYQILVDLPFYLSDAGAWMEFFWATATCGNDVMYGCVPSAVPIPPSALLMGSGLLCLAAVGWRKRTG